MYEDYKADVSATVEWQGKNHVQNNEQTINNCFRILLCKKWVLLFVYMRAKQPTFT